MKLYARVMTVVYIYVKDKLMSVTNFQVVEYLMVTIQ